MSSASRGARAAARSLQPSARAQTRRYASHGDSHSTGDLGQGPSAYQVDGGAASGSQGFGRGFWTAVAAVPAFYVSYQLASNPNNFVGRFFDGYAGVKEKFEGKNNSVHDAALKQAIEDRILLKGSARNDAGPPVRYQEQFNAGAAINVVAGEGTTDLSTLIKHYEETERKRAEAVRASKQAQ